MAKTKDETNSGEPKLDPSITRHTALIARLDGSLEHLAEVVATDFKHLEADAVAAATRVLHRALNELRGLGILPTP